MSASFIVRRASLADLADVVRVLAGGAVHASDASDEPPAPPTAAQRDAFAEIDADPNQLLVVAAVDARPAPRVVGTAQLMVLRHLMRDGMRAGQIESVHVEAAARGRGVGAQLMRHLIEECRRRGCARVQLTSDKRRLDAHRFYARLGFVASHEGFKLPL